MRRSDHQARWTRSIETQAEMMMMHLLQGERGKAGIAEAAAAAHCCAPSCADLVEIPDYLLEEDLVGSKTTLADDEVVATDSSTSSQLRLQRRHPVKQTSHGILRREYGRCSEST